MELDWIKAILKDDIKKWEENLKYESDSKKVDETIFFDTIFQTRIETLNYVLELLENIDSNIQGDIGNQGPVGPQSEAGDYYKRKYGKDITNPNIQQKSKGYQGIQVPNTIGMQGHQGSTIDTRLISQKIWELLDTEYNDIPIPYDDLFKECIDTLKNLNIHEIDAIIITKTLFLANANVKREHNIVFNYYNNFVKILKGLKQISNPNTLKEQQEKAMNEQNIEMPDESALTKGAHDLNKKLIEKHYEKELWKIEGLESLKIKVVDYPGGTIYLEGMGKVNYHIQDFVFKSKDQVINKLKSEVEKGSTTLLILLADPMILYEIGDKVTGYNHPNTSGAFLQSLLSDSLYDSFEKTNTISTSVVFRLGFI